MLGRLLGCRVGREGNIEREDLMIPYVCIVRRPQRLIVLLLLILLS